MVRIAFLPVVALAVAAPGHAKSPKFPPSSGQSANYACGDGRAIEVLYSGGDAVVVTIAGAPVQMARATAADGERYVGGGWQWWGIGTREGRLATLAPGETMASGAGARCFVR